MPGQSIDLKMEFKLRKKIIYEDEALILLNKPSTHPLVSLKPQDKSSIAFFLKESFPFLESVGKPGESGVVHRLDNKTSGLVLFAKTQTIYNTMRAVWNTNQVQKEYLALVLGRTPSSYVIQSSIAHHPSNKKKMMVCESDTEIHKFKARFAETSFFTEKVITASLQEVISLLRIKIQTGVRHQIRVHLASIGYPLLGDKLYQNTKKRRLDKDSKEGFYLHLESLKFNHPLSGKKMIFKADLEERFVKRIT